MHRHTMIKIFYHIYCIPDVTESIVHDQLTKLVFSGLYHTADVIYCCLSSGPDHGEVMMAVEARMALFGHKIRIIARQVGDCTYERFTFRAMLSQGLVTSDDKIMYLHSKGVTRKTDPTMEGIVHCWRTFMEYSLWMHHRQCIDLLDVADTVGVNYRSEPCPHYSGNFWWARGDYFLSLDPALLDVVHPGCDCNHISPELWIGTGRHNVGLPERNQTVRRSFGGMCILSSYHLPCYSRICHMSEYIDGDFIPYFANDLQ
jgi:hypothetical protein